MMPAERRVTTDKSMVNPVGSDLNLDVGELDPSAGMLKASTLGAIQERVRTLTQIALATLVVVISSMSSRHARGDD